MPLTENIRAVGSVKARSMSTSGSVRGGTAARSLVMSNVRRCDAEDGPDRGEEVLGHPDDLVDLLAGDAHLGEADP